MTTITTGRAPYGTNTPSYYKHEAKFPSTIDSTSIYNAKRKDAKNSVKAGFRIARNKQRWHDFTLNRGHIFGVFNGGYYVSTGEIVEFRKDKEGRSIAYYQLYYERGNANCIRWFSSCISERTPLGAAVKEAAKYQIGGVDYKPNACKDYNNMMKPSNANVNIAFVCK